jgi:CubicO group peptidase (beta-lactamase class C family)
MRNPRFPATLFIALTFAIRLATGGEMPESDRVYYPAPDAQEGWRALSGEDAVRTKACMELSRLDQAFEFVKGTTKNGGLLVVRNGWLVYERYFGQAHRESLCNTASCGKPFTSIAVGILMAEHPELFPDGLDQQIFTRQYFPPDMFPLSDPRKSKIRLGQLLSFTAGIRGNNPCYVHGEEVTIEPAGPDGWQSMVDEIATGHRDYGKPKHRISAATLWCEPGEGYSYASSSIHLASIMLRTVARQELQTYLDQKLAKPMGWGRWTYGYKSARDVTHTPGAGGIALRPTDMLRFGYLLLREGKWNDQQLVPAEFVRHCSRVSPYNPHYPYSLQFDVNSQGGITQLPRDAFWKLGSGGHCLCVVPSASLVLWKLGGRDSQYGSEDLGTSAAAGQPPVQDDRSNWGPSADLNTAHIMTIKLVLDAICS